MDPILHVADINAMADEHTGHWLMENPQHVVVVPEFAMIEMFKGDVRKNLRDNFRILKHFYHQCWRMKPSYDLRGISAPGYVRDAIDWDGTDSLRSLLVDMLIGQEELPQYVIDTNSNIANRRVNSIANNVVNNRSVLPRLEVEIRKCLNGRDACGIPLMSRKGITKIKNFAIDIARGHAASEGKDVGNMTIDAFTNTFAFRHAASCVSIFVNRVANGNMSTIGVEKLRNDVIDAHFMACATFVQGFRSYDEQTWIAYQILTKRILT